VELRYREKNILVTQKFLPDKVDQCPIDPTLSLSLSLSLSVSLCLSARRTRDEYAMSVFQVRQREIIDRSDSLDCIGQVAGKFSHCAHSKIYHVIYLLRFRYLLYIQINARVFEFQL
jgi:hypothetical protein